MEIPHKPCKFCGREFFKKATDSKRVWETRTKYCSKECANNSKIGKPTWNKGIKGSIKPNITSFKKGLIPWNKGLHYTLGPCSEATKEKIRMAQLGKKRPQTSKEKNPNWKGGITPENEIIRKSTQYQIWRKSVFDRDNYTCVLCGARNGSGKTVILHADHIKPFSLFPELRFIVDNGRTLCRDCHKKTDTYGSRKMYRDKTECLFSGSSA
jgi:5-methylcytosine-specific restriction endonuclease McrA